jgi:aminopeptidase YwaD
MEKIMKIRFLLAAIFLLSGFCYGQDLKRVRTYIDTLAAPGMHGRGYVSEGDKKAALYLEDQFIQIGLQSFKPSDPHDYFQYFKFNINTFPGEVCLHTKDKNYVPGKDFIVSPFSGSGKGGAKIKYLDTLIFTNENSRKKFLKTKTEPFALVYHAKNFKKINELSAPYAKKIFQSKCIIELNDKKLTASLSTTQSNTPYFQVKEEEFDSRSKKINFNLDAQLIKGYESQNVIGYIKGKTASDSFVVISAHYDHLGRMGKDVYFPGANDNASGISMLLELARYYSTPGNEPEYSIAFMAFGAEEAGLIGSEYYTKNPYFPLKKIKFLINLDLMGTGDEGITAVNATLFPDAFNLLVKINEEKKYLPAVKKRGPAANSDHYHFTQKGVPAFFLYTMGGITAYHDIYDRPETLPLTKFSEVFLLLTDFISKF